MWILFKVIILLLFLVIINRVFLFISIFFIFICRILSLTTFIFIDLFVILIFLNFYIIINYARLAFIILWDIWSWMYFFNISCLQFLFLLWFFLVICHITRFIFSLVWFMITFIWLWWIFLIIMLYSIIFVLLIFFKLIISFIFHILSELVSFWNFTFISAISRWTLIRISRPTFTNLLDLSLGYLLFSKIFILNLIIFIIYSIRMLTFFNLRYRCEWLFDNMIKVLCWINCMNSMDRSLHLYSIICCITHLILWISVTYFLAVSIIILILEINIIILNMGLLQLILYSVRKLWCFIILP